MIDELSVSSDTGRVYEHGWQSWSPSGDHPVTGGGSRPVDDRHQVMGYRPGRPAPQVGFQGEGLLAVDPGDGGPVWVYAAADGLRQVPSIRAAYHGGRLVVSADGPVDAFAVDASLSRALGSWAEGFAARANVGEIRPAPTVWCSWYRYFTDVTPSDIEENLTAIDRAGLPVEVIQIDDGWQAGIGDWLHPGGKFRSLPDLVSRIRDAGRRAGIWVAPFLAGDRSQLARDHPQWLIPGAGQNWRQRLAGLDPTHPGVAGYLREVFGRLREIGFDYYKIDFLYAAALPGLRDGEPLAGYREGLRLIRSVIGPDAYLLGCGAPIMPSVGLVDAMRVSSDVAATYRPADGDLSTPSQQAAALGAVARAWQHGRWWVNDADCLIARPGVEHRQRWAEVIERYGGLRASSDRIADLDEWGLATTRRLLSTVPPPTPLPLTR